MAKNRYLPVLFLLVVVCMGVGFVGGNGVRGYREVADSLIRKVAADIIHLSGASVRLCPNVTSTATLMLAPDEGQEDGPIRAVYTAEIGVREATGRNDGPRVAEYLQYCGLNSPNEWCAAFVSWSFGQAGYDQPRNPWSPALFPNAKVVWRNVGAKARDAPSASPEQVFGIYYREKGRIAHVGFVDGMEGDYLLTVEGNSNNSVQRRRRHWTGIYRIADWRD